MTATARTTIVLARHGQTVWHRENRYAGTSDIDLTDVGRGQAERLAQWAVSHRPDALACSPVRRARETTRPVAAALAMTPEVVEELREVDFGIAEGRTIGELRAEDAEMVERFLDDPVTHHFPEAEPPAAAAHRASRALHRIAGDHAGGTVLVVAHNTLIRIALCELIGVPLRSYRDVFPRLDNATLTTIALTADANRPAALLAYNVPITLTADGAGPAATPPAGSRAARLGNPG